MGSWQETEELIWARENVLDDYRFANKIADVTHKMVKYKLFNDDGVSVHTGSAYYNYEPITLQAIHEIGGVCGAISKYASGNINLTTPLNLIRSPHVLDVIQFGSVHLFVLSDSCLGITD